MASVVRHAHRFLVTMGLEGAHVIGHSRGGYLVARLTLLHPEIVKSCVIVDSGTLGQSLMPTLEGADRILLLSAIDLGRPPGTLVRLGWDDLPRALQLRASPHQHTVLEALAWLEFRRGRPQEFEVLGVQPASLAPGVTLTPDVETALRALDQIEISYEPSNMAVALEPLFLVRLWHTSNPSENARSNCIS